MRRREFITLLASGAVAWPLGVHAQQSAIPVVGFLNSGTADSLAHMVAGFQRGLNETDYIERQNLDIDFRWANGQYSHLPALAAEFKTSTVGASLIQKIAPDDSIDPVLTLASGLDSLEEWSRSSP